jgi:hypothetical protein
MLIGMRVDTQLRSKWRQGASMVELPGWAWQVLVGAGSGLALGVLIGAWRLRRSKAKKTHTRPAGLDELPPASSGPAHADTPQQRLLARLREQNLHFSNQLRANADLHTRQFIDKNAEQQAERLQHQREVDELRKTHSSELSYLMKVLLEQFDAIQKAHGHHVRALELEMSRLRALAEQAAADKGEGAVNEGAAAQRLEAAVTEVRSAEFAATRALESLRDH